MNIAGQRAFVGVVFDTTRARAAREALQEANERASRHLTRLEAVIGQMTEGLVIADPEGNVLSMNAAALALHELGSLQEVGSHLHQFEQVFELFQVEDGASIPLEHWPLSRATSRGNLHGTGDSGTQSA